MSIRVKTQPVEAITVSGASSMSVPEVEADVFRGVFLEIVKDGEVKTEEWLGGFPYGTEDVAIALWGNTQMRAGELAVDTGGGVYGDDCLLFNCEATAFTVDYLANDSLINAPGHDYLEDDRLVVRPHPVGGSLPAGMTGSLSYEPFRPENSLRAIKVATDTLELARVFTFTASNDGGDLLLTSSGHGLLEGYKFRAQGDDLPSTITAGVDYWVIASGLTASTFKVSTSEGGGAVAYGDSGSGTRVGYRSDKGMTYTSNGVGQSMLTRTGLPDFWIARCFSYGTGISQKYTGVGDKKFLGPVSGRPYNRFEYYVKYRPGHRASSLGGTSYGNQTTHTGTHNTYAEFNGFESDNYHFYFQSIHLAGQADGNWIRFVHSDRPTYQRETDDGANPGANPTPQTGLSFWDSETRIYLSSVQAAAHPEIYGTIPVRYDRVRIYYEEPPRNISATWDTYDKMRLMFVPVGTSDFAFTITNGDASPVTGKLRQGFGPWYSPQILDSSFAVVGSNDDVTLPASGTWSGYLRLTSATLVGSYTDFVSSVNFIPNDQFNASGILQVNHSDPNIAIDWSWVESTNYGPIDSWIYSASCTPVRCLVCTFDESTETVLCSGHALPANERIRFWSETGSSLPSEIGEGVDHWVRDPVAGVSFQITGSSLGPLKEFSASGSGALYVASRYG